MSRHFTDEEAPIVCIVCGYRGETMVEANRHARGQVHKDAGGSKVLGRNDIINNLAWGRRPKLGVDFVKVGTCKIKTSMSAGGDQARTDAGSDDDEALPQLASPAPSVSSICRSITPSVSESPENGDKDKKMKTDEGKGKDEAKRRREKMKRKEKLRNRGEMMMKRISPPLGRYWKRPGRAK